MAIRPIRQGWRQSLATATTTTTTTRMFHNILPHTREAGGCRNEYWIVYDGHAHKYYDF